METQNLSLPVNDDSEQVSLSPEKSSVEAIQAWLVAYLAELLDLEKDDVDIRTPFERYGLDSSAAINLIGDLENTLKCKLSPTLLYDYPTIEALSKNLAQ